MQNLKDIPSGCLIGSFSVAAVASGDSDIVQTGLYFPVDVHVVGAWYIPDSDCTGTATNYRTLTLVDCGTAGTGTGAIGAGKAFSSTGVYCAAHDAIAIAAATTVKNGTKVSAGHTVGVNNTKTSSGVAIPAGKIVVAWWPVSETIT